MLIKLSFWISALILITHCNALRRITSCVSFKKNHPDPSFTATFKLHSESTFAAAASENYTTRITENVFNRQVQVFRALSVGAVALILSNFDKLDLVVQSCYQSLLQFPFFHHYAFEPILASTCFAFFIGISAIIDYCVPVLWKYRIQPQGPGDTMIAWKERLRDALSFEVPLYLAFWIPFGGFVKARKIQTSVSLGLVIQEVFAALIIYDALFFLGHNLLHRSNFLYKSIHSKHHNQKVVRAGDSVRHTFLDGFWDVVCAVAALMILKAHALSRSIFNIIAIGLIVEAHSGSNFPWSLSNILPFNMVAGPVVHDSHHAQGGPTNLQKFFTYLDKIFGTAKLRKPKLIIQ